MTKEPKFKIGDWIRVPNHKHIFQFTSTFEEDDIEFITDGYDEIYGQQGWTIDEVELWEPKVGEWCWFFNDEKSGEDLTLGQYHSNRGSSFNCKLVGEEKIITFFCCEPFIGELPSFIKY